MNAIINPVILQRLTREMPYYEYAAMKKRNQGMWPYWPLAIVAFGLLVISAIVCVIPGDKSVGYIMLAMAVPIIIWAGRDIIRKESQYNELWHSLYWSAKSFFDSISCSCHGKPIRLNDEFDVMCCGAIKELHALARSIMYWQKPENQNGPLCDGKVAAMSLIADLKDTFKNEFEKAERFFGNNLHYGEGYGWFFNECSESSASFVLIRIPALKELARRVFEYRIWDEFKRDVLELAGQELYPEGIIMHIARIIDQRFMGDTFPGAVNKTINLAIPFLVQDLLWVLVPNKYQRDIAANILYKNFPDMRPPAGAKTPEPVAITDPKILELLERAN